MSRKGVQLPMKLPKSKAIPFFIAAGVILVGVHKVKGFISAWKRGISNARKRIENGNRPRSRKEEVDRALWGTHK